MGVINRILVQIGAIAMLTQFHVRHIPFGEYLQP